MSARVFLTINEIDWLIISLYLTCRISLSYLKEPRIIDCMIMSLKGKSYVLINMDFRQDIQSLLLEDYRFVCLQFIIKIGSSRSNVAVKYRHFTLLNIVFSKVPFWGLCYSCYYAYRSVCWDSNVFISHKSHENPFKIIIKSRNTDK